MSYTSVFGGNTIYPSDVSYLALALTADTELEWPLETATGNNIVARIIDITPTGAYSVIMPSAEQTGVGQVTQLKNIGPSTITIKDNAGGTLLSIAAGLTYTLYLTDNSTVAGTWTSFQAGASTAQAQASALAGYGLVAQSSLLSQSQDVTLFDSDFTLGAGNRASAFVWTGGLGTLTLPTASSVGNNWFMSVRNSGEGNLTLAGQGSDEINGAATLVLRPEDSATILTDGTDFFTIGYGQQAVFAFDYTSINVAGESGDYVLSGSELNRIAYSFVGALAGDIVIILPPTTQQYWVANNTTGGSYTLSIATEAQVTPIVVARGSRGIYYCEGADVIKADTASIALPIAISDGGTGATTAGGALINLGGTTVGVNLFTASSAANARLAIAAAGSGANSDITSLSGLTTPLSAAQGGTGLAALGAGVAAFLGTPSSANLRTAVTDETGSGALVFATSPTLVTPVLGTPASGTLTNCTNLPISTGVSGLAAGIATFLATPSSANLATAVTDETGSGALVFATSPTLVTPLLGTPTSGTLTNCTNLPISTGVSGLAAGVATFLATPSSANLRTAVTDETGSGALVFATSPTLVTPLLGTPTSGTLTNCTVDGTNPIGYRNLPANAKTGAYVLIASDVGKFIPITTGGVTVDISVFSAGDAVTIYNDSASSQTITQGTSMTMYLVGTATTGNRTLAQRGLCTIVFKAHNECVISGGGLT